MTNDDNATAMVTNANLNSFLFFRAEAVPSSGKTARRMNSRFVLKFKDDAELIDPMVFMIESGLDDINARPDDIVDCIQPLIGDSKEKKIMI